ncbi:hypothetical protein D5086_012348 [Populus alba]|uniref:Uncharacterized protein n=1 Tax=Populus alba TaxID=43335 RepID=A0ACC4C2C5_POPAL
MNLSIDDNRVGRGLSLEDGLVDGGRALKGTFDMAGWAKSSNTSKLMAMDTNIKAKVAARLEAAEGGGGDVPGEVVLPSAYGNG